MKPSWFFFLTVGAAFGLGTGCAGPSPQKHLLKIPGADHNSIFMAGLGAYLAAIRETVLSAGGPRSG
jgi:hypothetical protein